MSRYRSAVLGTAPVAYWRLGEASGTVAADEIGANDGTYTNAPTLGVTGALTADADTAATFAKASAEHVALGAARVLAGLASSSVVSWVDITDAADSNRAIYSERQLGNDIYRLGYEATTGRPQFFLRDDDGTLDAVVQASGSYVGTGWHLYAVTKSGTDLRLYVDGAEVKQQTLLATDTLTGATVTGRIGGDAFDANASADASIDEVAIWDRALAADEVAALYRVGRSTWNRSGRDPADPNPTNAAKHARYGL